MAGKMPPRPAGVNVVLRATRNGKDCWGDLVWKYEVPKFITLDADAVDAMRHGAILRRDEYIARQKEFGAMRDRESAKWAKDEATDALKEYRAACLILGNLLCDPPGDSLWKPEWEWSLDLAPWLDRVIRHCEA